MPQSVSVGPWIVHAPVLPHVATVSQPWTFLSPYSHTRPAGEQEPPAAPIGTEEGQGPDAPLELPPELLPLPELEPLEPPELPEPPPDAPLDPPDPPPFELPPFEPPPFEPPPFELPPPEAPELPLAAPELVPPPLPLALPSPFEPPSLPSPLLVNAEPPQATSRTSADPPTILRALVMPEA